MFRRSAVLLILSLCAAATGCSKGRTTHVVHGMVVYPDGKPLTKGTVEFEAIDEKRPITASSEINPDGTFLLGTFMPEDGAVAGRHRIAVIANPEIGTEAERPEKLPPALIASRFSEFKTSGLETIVEPRMNNVLIEVDYYRPDDETELDSEYDMFGTSDSEPAGY